MSLREELQKIEPVFKNDDGYDYRIVDDLTDSTLDEYINKVLDAVCEQVNNVGLSTDDEKATIQAINKLRGD